MSATGTSVNVAQYSGSAAGAAFDQIARDYDQIFTDSLIGRAQRNAVWEVLIRSFRKNENVLELNCGTGEDAIFLAGQGVSVFACDASRQMIETAVQRLRNIEPRVPAVFCELPTERIGELHQDTQFDGAFSNFSGLNCIADLEAVASSLAKLIKPGGRLLFCFSTRFCMVEMLYFLVRGQWLKAARRCNGSTRVTLGNAQFTVYYPTIGRIRRAFAPEFCLYDFKGIGVTIPPSYLEGWVRRHLGIFRLLCRLEGLFAGLPLVRATGDHVLLCFEKVPR